MNWLVHHLGMLLPTDRLEPLYDHPAKIDSVQYAGAGLPSGRGKHECDAGTAWQQTSGGRTMTLYPCALEPPIKVAVEFEGNSENLAGPSYAPPGENRALDSRTLFSHTWKGMHTHAIVLHSDPSIRLTGRFLKPEKGDGPFPTIFHAAEREKHDPI